jgi:glucose-1-phosphatase
MQNIKNIIFDLGNVILNIDYDAPVQAFRQLGITNFETIFSKAAQTNLADDIETGKISDADFINHLLQLCNTGTTQQQVIDAWNAIIINFPLRRLQILQQLQLHYNMYLLSNTNSIHEQCYNKLLFSTVGYNSLSIFFDKIYLSHQIGLRKPDVKAWQLILNEHQLKPEETLFLDDSPQHIAAATTLSLQCIHVTPENSMEAIFRNR